MRAELFSSDFLISFFIFLAAMLIITTYYQNLQNDVYETSARNDMYSRAIGIAGLLATSSGYPKYWNTTNVQVIGLYDAGKFNLTKFEYLCSIPHKTAKSMLGTGAYDFFLSLKSNNTDVVINRPGYNYSCGNLPSNQQQVMSVKRLGVVTINGSSTKATMEVLLWG